MGWDGWDGMDGMGLLGGISELLGVWIAGMLGVWTWIHGCMDAWLMTMAKVDEDRGCLCVCMTASTLSAGYLHLPTSQLAQQPYVRTLVPLHP
jgi:hypothetical protein